MSKELVISSTRHETRVAMIEDDEVVEVYHQRENEYSLAGSIHKGRVTRVLPGMQSAFVDIGLERDAFLYVSDFFEDNEEYDKIGTSVEDKILKLATPAAQPAPAPPAPSAAPVLEEAAQTAENVVDAAPEPVGPAAPQVLLPAPSSAVAGAPAEPRRDEFERDRRGRRGRRRRGQRRDGGRGLPDSKFNSPGSQPAPRFGPEAETQPEDHPEMGGAAEREPVAHAAPDRKSTRLNSSH